MRALIRPDLCLGERLSLTHGQPLSRVQGSWHGQAVVVLATWAELPALAMTTALSAWACQLGQQWVAAEVALG